MSAAATRELARRESPVAQPASREPSPDGAPAARVLELQRSAGNAAVSALLEPPAPAAAAGAAPAAPASPGAAAPSPAAAPASPVAAASAPASPAARDPHADPRFAALEDRVAHAAAGEKAHPPARAAAAAAHAAAAPPADDRAGQAAAAQLEDLAAQPPGGFDRASFAQAVRAAITAAAQAGNPEAAKAQVSSLVNTSKQAAERDVNAPPDTSRAAPKPVTPLAPEQPGAPPQVVAADAMPGPRPPQDVDLSGGPAQIDALLASHGVTDEQLAESNEPDFLAALKAREDLRAHSVAAPLAYRQKEKEAIAGSRAEADTAATGGVGRMRKAKVAALAAAIDKQTETKGAEEAKREKVGADIQAIYDRTKADVTRIIESLDRVVETMFSMGQMVARMRFEGFVEEKVEAYESGRYSGLGGKFDWLGDRATGMPAAVKDIYAEGRAVYLKLMDGTIDQIADLVARQLGTARTRIAGGRDEVRRYVRALPEELREIGRDAEDRLESRFDELAFEVDATKDTLVEQLADTHRRATAELDKRIEELNQDDRGWLSKAWDFASGVVKAIAKLKDLIVGVVKRAVSVLDDIILHPIRFLETLVEGVRRGLDAFKERAVEHLENAFAKWLLGTLAGAGITVRRPLDDFSNVLDLAAQLLGLTYDKLRARVVKKLGDKGEEAVGWMEEKVAVFQKLKAKGVAGIWEDVQQHVSNLADLVLGSIKDFVVKRVITGAVGWLGALFTPATAFIRACKALYDIFTWVWSKIDDIKDFVDAVLDSLAEVAAGKPAAVAKKVEDALAKALPVGLGFLASLLNLGSLSDKVREIVEKVRAPIAAAVDRVVMAGVKLFKRTFGRAAGAFGKAKHWAKAKGGAVVGWVKGKLGLVEVHEDFEMEGESHTLTALSGENALNVQMASGVGVSLAPLVVKALDIVAKSRHPQKAAILDVLSEVNGELTAAQVEWGERRRALAAKAGAKTALGPADQDALLRQFQADEERALAGRVKGLVGKLRRLPARSIQTLLDQISGRRMVPPTLIKAPGRFRELMYNRPANWDTVRSDMHAKVFVQIESLVQGLSLVRPSAHGRDDTPAHVTARQGVQEMSSEPFDNSPTEPGGPGQLDAGAEEAWEKGQLMEFFRATRYPLDHIRPLAKHWVQRGWNSDEKDRGEEASSEDNLRYITEKWNAKKGSKEGEGVGWFYNDKPYIGDQFESAELKGNTLGGEELIVVKRS